MTHVCFVGYGIYPPWNEGRKVISRNIIDALKQHTDLDVSVVSSVGKGYERKKGVEYANSTWLTSYTKGYDPLLDAAMIKLISPHLNKLKRLRVPRAIDRYITTSIETGWFADLGITNSQNVNPPINTDTFKPEAKLKARRYFNLPADKFIVLYMGNMSEVRFSPNLLSETKFLRDPNNLLLIAANLIDSYWQNNNLLHKENIILKKGILNEKEKAMLYNTSDAFILPFDTKLKSYKHVFVIDPPITMLEAMSCGVPVIAPDVFSIPKIIKEGYNGYVTSLGDFGMIDDVLYHLSKEKVEEASINARNTILNEFSYEKTALKMKRIYEGILNG
jgi:glycosyltransferase involved in cell wall biosynthesis